RQRPQRAGQHSIGCNGGRHPQRHTPEDSARRGTVERDSAERSAPSRQPAQRGMAWQGRRGGGTLQRLGASLLSLCKAVNERRLPTRAANLRFTPTRMGTAPGWWFAAPDPSAGARGLRKAVTQVLAIPRSATENAVEATDRPDLATSIRAIHDRL